MPFLGGWEITSINTAHTGQPLDVAYSASGANIVSSLSNDYRGQPFLRPNVTGSAVSQSRSAMLNTYFAGYSFTNSLASAPFGAMWAAIPSGCPTSSNGILRSIRTSTSARRPACRFARSSSTSSTIADFGIPDTKTTDAAFGTIRNTFPSRQGQVAAKLIF